ncbi:MAG: hypothetical protein AAGD10_16665 [Myxococcota bacterium]
MPSALRPKPRRPIYLRIAYEFDGPDSELVPTHYIDAHYRFVDVMRADSVEELSLRLALPFSASHGRLSST